MASAALFFVACVLSSPISAQDSRPWKPTKDDGAEVTRLGYFPRIAEFQKPPRHPRWREANLVATLPGWKRFGPAEEWLRKNQNPTADVERRKFEDYIERAQAFAPEQHDELFERFLKWRETRDRR